MNHDNQIVDVSRRRILKTIGVISGAAVAAPMIPGVSGKAIAGTAANILSGKRAVRIGLLLPGASVPTSHAARLRKGLELALALNGDQAGGRRIRIIPGETLPSAGAAVRAAQTLALDHRADIVVGMVGPRVTRMVSDMFEKEGTLFIEAGAGEQITGSNERRSHIFHSSLCGWESMMAMGTWAARNIGRKGAVAASFYDSGYDMLSAFRCGFEGAGGTITTQRITGAPGAGGDITIANAVKAIADARPDFILGLYAEGAALAFLDGCHRMRLTDGIPMLSSGLAVDEYMLPERGRLARGMRSAHTWSATLSNEANRKFVGEYLARTGERADATAMLGYETGLMIAAAIENAAGDIGGIGRALEGLSIESPRGRVTIDPSTHATVAPHHLREVAGEGRNRIVGELRPDRAGGDAMLAIASEPRSGWIHSQMWG
jgi:branched-chain amino acid transport system substrate-binding protein